MKETKFKQTEVGMMPSDWEVKTIGSFCKVYDGTHQTPNYVDFGIPFYSVENVSADDFEHTKYISLEEYTQISKRANITQGDILMTRIGSIGVCKYVDWNCKAGFYVSLALLKCNDRVDARFICHLSNSENFKKEIELHSLLTAIPQKINLGPISDVRIALPKTIEEQQRIANALSDVDSLIANLEKLIAKKKNIKQGAMQQLLSGKKRLPGFSGKWENYVIGESGSLVKSSINPQVKPMQYFNEYSMPAYDTFRKPQRVLGSSMHSNRIQIDGEILLFNKLNVRQQRVWYIEKCANNAVCSTEFLPYSSKIIDLQLMRQILLTDQVTADFIGMSTGTSNSQKRITPKHFLNYSLFLPPTIKEQKAIAKIFVDMDSEIAALETKLAKYRQLKTGMMQQLLTGKVRLI